LAEGYPETASKRVEQAKFCEQEGLSANSFSFWKSTIKQRDAAKQEQEVKRALKRAAANRAARASEPAAFVPLLAPTPKTAPEENAEHCVAEMFFASGSIRIMTGADSQTLGALLKALKEAALC
jgi:hypothetical protein